MLEYAVCSALEVFSIYLDSVYPTYPLGAGAELKGDMLVGLREIYIALARFI